MADGDSSDEGGDYWLNRRDRQHDVKAFPIFDSATDLMEKFVKYVKKRHIAWLINNPKFCNRARFQPFDQFFESYEGLLYLLKLYFEDVHIICEIDVKYSIQILDDANTHWFKRVFKTLKDVGVFSHCFREQLREQYNDVFEKPEKYLDIDFSNFSNQPKFKVHSPIVTEFRINIPFDSPIPIYSGFECDI